MFIGSGKLGFPQDALLAFTLGCDMVNVAREAMFAIGCIQAQRCHTNHCPTGVATQNTWLQGGGDPRLKSVRVANYVVALRKDILSLSRACGVPHPSEVRSDQLEFLDDRFGAKTAADVFGRRVTWPTSSAHPERVSDQRTPEYLASRRFGSDPDTPRGSLQLKQVSDRLWRCDAQRLVLRTSGVGEKSLSFNWACNHSRLLRRLLLSLSTLDVSALVRMR